MSGPGMPYKLARDDRAGDAQLHRMAIQGSGKAARELRAGRGRHDHDARHPMALADADPHHARQGEQRLLMRRENVRDGPGRWRRAVSCGVRGLAGAPREQGGGPEPQDRRPSGQT